MKRLISRLWGWLKALSTRVKVLIGVVLAALVGFLIWAVFFWFAFQTYFIDDEVDEAGPVFDSGVVADTSDEEPGTPAAEPTASDTSTADQAAPTAESAQPDAPSTSDVAGPAPGGGPSVGAMPGDEISEELQAEMDEFMEEEGMPAEVEVEEPMPDMPEQPQIRVEASGPFIDRSHPTSGNAIVLGDGTGQRFLRFEDFRTDNGPDLNVYLSSAPQDAPAGQFDDDFIDLGDLKGNVGSQNYEIPRDVDLDHYSTVVIWCVRFSVIFGAAELAPS
jgi:hypothetical protein